MHRQRLEHVFEPGGTYFVTVTLLDRRVDLSDGRLAPLVVSALKHFEEKRYLLFDYVVMPDHVHFLVKPLQIDGEWLPLSRIYHSFKSFTANQINRALGRTGALWQDDTYDRVVRGRTDFEEKAKYILMNPLRKGLVSDPLLWPWWGRGSGIP